MDLKIYSFAKNYEIFIKKPLVSQILVGESPFIKELRKIALKLSTNSVPVLLNGELGTGKSLFAETVFYLSENSWNNFFNINCSMISEQDFLQFLELIKDKSEKITVYIKNVESASKKVQDFIYSIIKTEGNKIRFIFSTTASLEKAVEAGDFSENLLFLISNVTINFLPLRQRREDIVYITSFFFKSIKLSTGIQMKGFSEDCIKEIKERYWKGNCFELKNSLERAFMLGNVPCIYKADMGFEDSSLDSVKEDAIDVAKEGESKNLKDALDSFKKVYLTKILEENKWNQTKTAKILGIQRTYVIKLINDLNIKKR